METIDEEVLSASVDFIRRSQKEGKPFFVWFNTSRMHIWTHLKPASVNKTGLGVYPDGMVEHDGQIGQMLRLLDDLGITENTIVIWTTDNGAEVMSWPDGGTTLPRREEHELGGATAFPRRAPARRDRARDRDQRDLSHEDWLPTLVAAVGGPNVKARSSTAPKLRRHELQGSPRRLQHVPIFRGEAKVPRKEFMYWTTTAASPGFATTSGSSCSWSSAPTASTSGRSPW